MQWLSLTEGYYRGWGPILQLTKVIMLAEISSLTIYFCSLFDVLWWSPGPPHVAPSPPYLLIRENEFFVNVMSELYAINILFIKYMRTDFCLSLFLLFKVVLWQSGDFQVKCFCILLTIVFVTDVPCCSYKLFTSHLLTYCDIVTAWTLLIFREITKYSYRQVNTETSKYIPL